MIERTYEDGAFLCHAGEPAEAMFRVRSGELLVEPAGGVPARSYVLRAGEIFGCEALLAGVSYQATARARGRTVVETADVEAMLAALLARPDAALPLARAAFDLAMLDTAPAEPPIARSGGAAASPGPSRTGEYGLRLMPATPALIEQIGADGVVVSSFPFIVGRRETRGDGDGARGVDLVLHDSTPYNLSRRHFAIERDGERYVVRDCGSYHGTIVNGMPIGGHEIRRSAPLRPGENAIVAGKPSSPIRFSFVVD